MQFYLRIKKIPWRKIIAYGFIGFIVDYIVSFSFSIYFNHPRYSYIWTILMFTIFAGTIIESILWINRKIDKRLSWVNHQTKRFWVQLFIDWFATVTIATITTIVVMTILPGEVIFLFDLIVINSLAVIFVFIIVSIDLTKSILEKWKLALLENEVFKKENAEAKYESLKNQLSPHFLFNNLNTLYGLIKEKNDELASNYLLKLSEIYRYVLVIRDVEVISLTKEIKFIKDYTFLLSTRYSSNFNIEINIQDRLLNEKFLPPFTLQVLIENAEKHNVINDRQTMHVKIYTENNNYIVVENNILKRPKKVESTNIGLKNLRSRYQYLSNVEIHILKTKDHFIVKVPLLEIEKNDLIMKSEVFNELYK